MDIYQTDEMRTYVEEWYPNYYNLVKETINRFNEDLRMKLEIYYLKKCTDSYGSYSSYVRSFTNSFCQSLNELNTSELEDYLEYCLEFYEQDFSRFLYEVNVICVEANRVLKEICSCYMRYGGKNDRDKILQNVYLNTNQNEELVKVLKNVVETEKKHILNCYEKAKNKETFCETCTPYCSVKEENNKVLYKRTTSVRI